MSAIRARSTPARWASSDLRRSWPASTTAGARRRRAVAQAPQRARGTRRRGRDPHPPPARALTLVGRSRRSSRRSSSSSGRSPRRVARAPRRRALPVVVQRPEIVITAAELVAEIGDCRGRYPTRDALAGDAGQAAVAIESGKRKVACFRWACNKRLRDSFCTLADTTRHWHPWAADLYAPALARGHDHPRAIRTLGRAWCRIVWRCWQDRVPYDPPATARCNAIHSHDPESVGPRPDTAATQRMLGTAVTHRAARRAEREALGVLGTDVEIGGGSPVPGP